MELRGTDPWTSSLCEKPKYIAGYPLKQVFSRL